MSLNLRNAAQTFQRFIDDLSFGFVNLVDIQIASADEKQHLNHSEKKFHRLSNYGAKNNPQQSEIILLPIVMCK